MFLTWSYARPVANTANEPVNATLPATASPAATSIMFCSAIPTLKKRSGYASANVAVVVDWFGPVDFLTMDSQLAESGLGPTDHGVFKSIYFFDPNGHRVELAVDTGTPAEHAELKRVADAMLEEWSRTKKAPQHAAWVHEKARKAMQQ